MYGGNFVPLAKGQGPIKIKVTKKENAPKVETRSIECQTDISALKLSQEIKIKVKQEQLVHLVAKESINTQLMDDFDDLGDLMGDITKGFSGSLPKFSDSESE